MIIKELDDVVARQAETAAELLNLQNYLGDKAIIEPFDKIVEQNLFSESDSFASGEYTRELGDSIPDGTTFVLADVFINDLKNEHWTVLFSRDGDCDGQAYADAETGLPPKGDFNDRSQTTFLAFDASEAGGDAFPRFGQWT